MGQNAGMSLSGVDDTGEFGLSGGFDLDSAYTALVQAFARTRTQAGTTSVPDNEIHSVSEALD